MQVQTPKLLSDTQGQSAHDHHTCTCTRITRWVQTTNATAGDCLLGSGRAPFSGSIHCAGRELRLTARSSAGAQRAKKMPFFRLRAAVGDSTSDIGSDTVRSGTPRAHACTGALRRALFLFLCPFLASAVCAPDPRVRYLVRGAAPLGPSPSHACAYNFLCVAAHEDPHEAQRRGLPQADGRAACGSSLPSLRCRAA